jgi:DNA invertase Pin-like site-specific DNA recombinase
MIRRVDLQNPGRGGLMADVMSKRRRRPQLELLMGFVRSGDSVVVHSMDRLARNLDDLRRIVQTLTRRNVRIEFLKEHLTFTGGGFTDGQLDAVGDGCVC